MGLLFVPGCGNVLVGADRSAFLSAGRCGAVSGRQLGCGRWTRGVGGRRRAPSPSSSPARRGGAGLSMALVDPWSVSSTTIASQLFAASLFPYIAFLRALSRKEADCPKMAFNGFCFLLVFVFASIPAGIYAKVQYNEILANVDWLHGGAESFLTITNLLILFGFKQQANSIVGGGGEKGEIVPNVAAIVAAVGAAAAVTVLNININSPHPQPVNALSIATWAIHISSLIEWLGCMDLVWERAELSGNEKWKGLTWGMLPLHTSGLLACTYHLFYNAPLLDPLVAVQAGLTLVGNTTMWLGARRILATAEESSDGPTPPAVSLPLQQAYGAGRRSLLSELTFVTVLSVLGAVGLRYLPLFVDFPFEPSLPLASAFVVIPTALNTAKWLVRSRNAPPTTSTT